MPAALLPPTASMVPPRMVMLLPVLSFPPPMPAPPSPPSAVRDPLVSLSSLMVSLPEMVSPSSDISSSFSKPALQLPLFSLLSPSSSMVASPPPCTVTAALLSRTGPSSLPSPSFFPLTSIFRSSKVTSTLPPEVSMVTVCSSDLPVMTVSVSSLVVPPCVTLFVLSAPPASTVMLPSAMSHRIA